MYFAWDEKNNKMVYLMPDLETVYYPEEYTVVPGDCWITCGTAAEANKVQAKGFNIALERDIEETIVLTNVVSINTLGYTASDVQFNGISESVTTTAYMIGSFGEISGSIGGANIIQQGNADKISVSGASNSSVTVSGAVNNYSSSVSNSTISAQGTVATLSSGTTVTNNGVIKNASSGSSINNNGTISQNTGASVTGSVTNIAVAYPAGTKEDIENLRYQVMAGGETFKDRTVEFTSDINLNNIAFCPISSYFRKDENEAAITKAYAESHFFQGVVDGKGYTVQNLSNDGFSVSGLTASTNSTSEKFNGVLYKESVYGLFASVYNATFKNFNITCDIKMMKSDKDKMVGDSVGALVGFSVGNLTLENITVSGSIEGYDGVGGIVGRCYSAKNDTKGTIKMTNVVNNANVKAARKCGGIIGYISDVYVDFTNVVNNGNVENLGWKYDKDTLHAGITSGTNGTGHYIAAAAYTGKAIGSTDIVTTKITGFTQKSDAKIIIAGKECNYLAVKSDASWTDREGY